MVEFLLGFSASVDQANSSGVTSLYIASQGGHSAVVVQLLAAEASVNLALSDGCTPLYVAAQEGHSKVIQQLLAVHASVDLGTNSGVTSLIIASQQGHSAVVVQLLAANASVDLAKSDGFTPLLVASRSGRSAVVEVLLAAGASVNLATDPGGFTPLLIASHEGHIAVVRHLLASDASINLGISAFTPLMVAAHLNRTAVVQLLEVWPVLSELMIATVMRRHSSVRELLHSGEDPAVTVQYQERTLSALILATMNEATCSWAAPVCTRTVHLIKQSLMWSPRLEVHQLFPLIFRRGVRHILGLMVAIEPVHCGLPRDVWMRIIACLPRDWGLTAS